MESPSTTNAKDFEVTGVSRSGRVRKKSSKLLDFQSPDDIEPKLIKRTPKSSRRKPKSEEEEDEDDDVNDDVDEDDVNDTSNLPSDSDSDEIEEMVADIVEEVEAEAEGANDPTFRQSLYMSEKSNKKKMLKDGKIVMGKAQRKDKGRARFTAYSLWARDIRKTGQFDFTNAARRLSEMWANVSANEKLIWRRRAKRLSARTKNRPQLKEPISPSKSTTFLPSSPTSADKPTTSSAALSPSTFLNRATTSRTKKLVQQSVETKSKTAATPTTPVKRTRRETATAAAAAGTSNTPTSSTSANLKNSTIQNENSYSAEFNITSHEPIDVAAYLKLLGDSLSIIGERLKEHEGQIAVSGSLSVLLDSLLCSLGPLMCLTTQIPGLELKPELNENLQATLDNIAYIMPGL